MKPIKVIEKLNESDNPELDKVLHEIKDEMENQDLHSYDIKSNETDEMMFFIDNVVRPIVNKSDLDDNLKDQIVGYMIMDINDNKKWSIKTGVKTIMDWYKVS